jgi:DNA-binding transcriptional LysR family regulator
VMLDVRRLRMLAALDRLGTIAAVAAELHLTAPGVSMQLGSFERELGVPLTERRGRRLALTPAGRLLAAHGHDVVDRLSLAELEVEALRKGAVGSYRVAAFPSAARTFVAAAWRRLIREDAPLELTVTTPEPEDALAALTSGVADLAVVHAYSNVPRDLPTGLAAEPLGSEPVLVAVPEADAPTTASVDLAELRDLAWITPVHGLTCFEMTERACGRAGFRPRIVAESMDFAAQLELVAAGVGVALMPVLTVAAVPAGVRLLRPA